MTVDKLEVKRARYPDWKDDYNSKLITAEDAVKLIKNHDVLTLSGGYNVPKDFVHAFNKEVLNLQGIKVCTALALDVHDFMKPSYKDNLHVETAFLGPAERQCLQWNTATFTPIHLSQLPRWLEYNRPNVAAFICAPPDENGYMNRSCFGNVISPSIIADAEHVIVEVNPQMPWLVSEALKIHVSEVDYIIESNTPVTEIKEPPITNEDKIIAKYIAEMVNDGDTIQIGLGGLAFAIGYFLDGKKDLGVHTELVNNSIMELMKLGVINNTKKNYCTGKVVSAFCVGDRKLWEFVDHNHDFFFNPIDYNNDPRIIGRNDNLVSINNALMIDLTGQVASESIGFRQYSGTGGQVNFVLGSYLSQGGKAILAFNSTYIDENKERKSRIMPALPYGTIVSTSRNDVQYIVTEYGVANLRLLNLPARARALIKIAHPDFRDELTFEAKRAGWL